MHFGERSFKTSQFCNLVTGPISFKLSMVNLKLLLLLLLSNFLFSFFSEVQQPNSGLDSLVVEIYRHTRARARAVGLL
jgi:hypothetical protein